MKTPHKRVQKTGTGGVTTAAAVRKGAKTGMAYNGPRTKSQDAGTKGMTGVRGGKSKAGGTKAGSSNQGDKKGGQTAGRGRTSKGRNKIGSGRSQAFT
jgi:hypothetical protein